MADHSVRFLFFSSVSVAQGRYIKEGPVPETVLLDASMAVGNGYGESKYIVERVRCPVFLSISNTNNLEQIVDVARQKGLEATSLRLGQVCGSETSGVWNTSDWTPAIVKSSVNLGMLPDAEGVRIYCLSAADVLTFCA